MKSTLIYFFMIILFMSAVTDVSACATGPRRGYSWSKGELVDNAKAIVVVEIEKQTVLRVVQETDIDDEESFYSAAYKIEFKIIEVIQGSVEKPLLVYLDRFYSGSSDDFSGATKHYYNSGTDFNGHDDIEFWTGEGMGRSSQNRELGIDCGPPHIFVEGETYLYFPDANGAIKSAEIIKSEDDRWYAFVKDRVENNKTRDLIKENSAI